jgi:hypothetical protein
MIVGRKAAGTRGRKLPVETSPSSCTSPICCVTIWREGELHIAATSGQELCVAAMAAKSIAAALGG